MSRTPPSDQPIETHSLPPDVDDTQPVEPPPGGPPGGDGGAVPAPPPPPTNLYKSTGHLDALTATGVARGWALDPDVPNQAITVRFYVAPMSATTLQIEMLADLPGTAGEGANHGFAWRIPDSFRDGQPHTFYVYAIDSSWLRKYSPLLGQLNFTLQPSNEPPVGKLDLIQSSGVVTGWALDPNAHAASITVSFYVDHSPKDGPLTEQVLANLPRPDATQATGVPGNHGFQWSIPPQFRDGMNHSLYAYATDSTSQSTAALSGSPRTFALLTSEDL